MAKKIYGLIVIILFAAMLTLPTVIWGGMIAVGGDEFIADNVAAQLLEEELRRPMTFAEVFEGKKNEDGTVEPFSVNDLTANLEALYNDYAPFRTMLISVKRSLTTALERPYDRKIKPALIELWYGDKGGGGDPNDTVENLDDILNQGSKPTETDPVDDPVGDVCEHEYGAEVTAPTCTDKGYTTHTCAKCGEFYTDTYVDATGHASETWIVDKEATCTDTGARHKVCDACATVFADEITQALGHVYEHVVTKPTCAERGYTTHRCVNPGCDQAYADTYVSSIGHHSETWIIEKNATATENGRRYKKCDDCSLRFVEEDIPMTSCSFKNYVYNNDATCVKDGTETAVCEDPVCGKQHTRVKVGTAKGHSHKATVVKPTCTEQGYTLHTCACGDSYKDLYEAPLGHKSETWLIKKEATCTAAGERYKKCTVCGKGFANESIAATGHSYQESTVAPTCASQGYTLHTCRNVGCGHTYRTNITPALAHQYEYVIDLAASCGVTGVRHKECRVCHAALAAEKIPMATAHSGSSVIKTVTPSYEDAGYTLKRCDVCGREYRDDIVPKLIDTRVYPIEYLGSNGILGRVPNPSEREWLFYKDDLSWYKGGTYDANGKTSNYNNIKPLIDYCESKGIKLVIAVWPNKSTVYREYMPTIDGATPGSKMQDYVNTLNTLDPRVHAIFPVDELRAYNSYFQTYFKYDTHWNMAGAYIGVQAMYKAIGLETIDLRLLPATPVSASLSTDNTKFHNGNNLDLINIAGFGGVRQEFSDDICYDITYRPDVTYREYSYRSNMSNKTENPAMFLDNEITKSFSPDAANGKIVFVGDSFRNYVRPFLAKDFKEATVLHYSYLSDIQKELQALGEGDVLVISRVERAGAMHDQIAKDIYDIVS